MSHGIAELILWMGAIWVLCVAVSWIIDQFGGEDDGQRG